MAISLVSFTSLDGKLAETAVIPMAFLPNVSYATFSSKELSTPPENAIKAFKAIINMNKWEYALILLIGIESLVPTTNDFNILWKAFSIQKGYAINEDGLIVHSSKPNIPILISENHPDASLIRLTKYAITRINLSQNK